MKILGREFSFKKTAEKKLQPLEPYSQENLYARMVLGELSYQNGVEVFNYNLTTFAKYYQQNPNFYKVVQKIAGPAKYVPVKVYLKQGNGKRKEVHDTPLNAMWQGRMNETQRSSDYLEEWIVQHCTFGNNFMYGLETVGFGIEKLYNVPPDITTIIPGEWRQPVKGYKTTFTKGRELSFPPETIKHVKKVNINNDYECGHADRLYGMSPAAPLDLTIKSNNEGVKADYYMKKNGFPTSILSPESDTTVIDKKGVKAFWKRWRGQVGGGENANKPLFSSIALKLLSLGYKPTDLDLINANKAQMLTIAGVFNVPDPIVDPSSSGKYSNMAEANKALWTDAIQPVLTLFMDAFNDFVTASINEATGKSYVCEFDYSGIRALQPDKKAESDRITNEFTKGLHTLGQARELLNYPTEGIDEAILTSYFKAPAAISFNQDSNEKER